MSPPLIDVNVSLSRWPARRLPLDEAPRLVEKLRFLGVVEAWASSFDAILHKDIAEVNARLASDCREYGDGLLRPFGAVNLSLPDWQDDVRRCREQHGMSGVRLLPGYHGYSLDSPALAALFALAGEHELIVQLAVRQEDPRTQHRLLSAADAELTPLVALLKQHPGVRLVVLNGLSVLGVDVIDSLVAAGEVFFDIATLEGVGGLERLVRHLPMERVLLGTHAPLFAAESALLKLRESNLGEAATAAIRFDNARKLLPAE